MSGNFRLSGHRLSLKEIGIEGLVTEITLWHYCRHSGQSLLLRALARSSQRLAMERMPNGNDGFRVAAGHGDARPSWNR